MGLKIANNAASILAGAITDSYTTISIRSADAGEFPSLAPGDYFMATMVDAAGNREIIKVTARTGAVLTVNRAQEGTTARAFQAGDSISNRFTAGQFTQLVSDLETLLANLGALAYLGIVNTPQIADGAVTDQKLRSSAGLSVVGRGVSSAGPPADIGAGSDNTVLLRSGSALFFNLIGTANLFDLIISTNKLIDGAVTNAKIAGGAVSTSSIADGQVTPAKMSNGALDNGTAETGSDGAPRLIAATVLKHAIGYHTAPYAGSNDVETSYPVGHHVLINDCQSLALNATFPLYAGSGYGPKLSGGGSFLAGTWALRGTSTGSPSVGLGLFQRIF